VYTSALSKKDRLGKLTCLRPKAAIEVLEDNSNGLAIHRTQQIVSEAKGLIIEVDTIQLMIHNDDELEHSYARGKGKA
jgi:hypothetical protein